jgi:hypothetical protein
VELPNIGSVVPGAHCSGPFHPVILSLKSLWLQTNCYSIVSWQDGCCDQYWSLTWWNWEIPRDEQSTLLGMSGRTFPRKQLRGEDPPPWGGWYHPVVWGSTWNKRRRRAGQHRLTLCLLTLWGEQLCSIVPFCHDIFPHHRPRKNAASWPWTETFETMSQKKSFLL